MLYLLILLALISSLFVLFYSLYTPVRRFERKPQRDRPAPHNALCAAVIATISGSWRVFVVKPLNTKKETGDSYN